MIVTFYSYKGGVGRSMAMANVADIMARRGARVLMIDFDLEAPGLEQYFKIPQANARRHPGLVDLLTGFKSAMSVGGGNSSSDAFRDVGRFILPVYERLPGGGRLDLLPAGSREDPGQLDRYSLAVRTFDWQDFFFNWEGELFFEWLRGELVPDRYDLVLVDSRTGVTEMGGICAYQLGDLIVMMCGANRQNLRGTQDVAADFLSPRVLALRRDRPPQLLLVPARVEQRDPALFEHFVQEFNEKFSMYLPAKLREAAIGYAELMVPYEPEYAFEERVVTDPGATRELIGAAFGRLANAIALLAPTGTAAARLSDRPAGETGVQAPVPAQYDPTARFSGYDIYLVAAAEDRSLVQALADRLTRLDLRVYVDLIEALSGTERRQRTEQILFHSKVCIIGFGQGTHAAWEEASRTIARTARITREMPVVALQLGPNARASTPGPRTIDGAFTLSLPKWPESDAGFDTLQAHLRSLHLPHAADSPIAAPLPAASPPPSAPTFASEPKPVSGTLSANRAGNEAIIERGNPYRGLDPFFEEHAPFFFGRESMQAQFEAATRGKRVWVVGPSASGKTSFVAAGVFPTLRKTAGFSAFDRLVVEPGCASALEAVLSAPRTGSPDRRNVLFVDRFERCMQIGFDPAERNGILARIEGLFRNRPDLLVIIAVREDVTKALASTVLPIPSGEAEGIGIVRIANLLPEELRSIIEKPAERAGLACEPGLVDRLVKDVGLDAATLPIVELMLSRLWQRRREGWLTNTAYESIIGIKALTASLADDALERLGDESSRALALMARLVQQGDDASVGQRRAWRGELLGIDETPAALDALIERLVSARVLVACVNAAAEPCVELVYESLAKDFPPLNAFISLNRDFLIWRQTLNAYRNDWESNEREDRALLSGSVARAAKVWLVARRHDLNAAECAYIERSAKNERRMWIARVAGIAFWLTIIGGWYLYDRHQKQVEQGVIAKQNDDRQAKEEADRKEIEMAARQVELGDLSAFRGDYERAAELYTNALPKYADRSAIFMKRAQVYAAQNERAKAIDDYREVLALNPKAAKVHLLIGELLAASGETEAAEQSFTQAIVQDDQDDDAVAFFSRGGARDRLNRAEDAIADFTEAIKRNPSYTEALFARGQLNMRLKRDEAAVADFEQVLKVSRVASDQEAARSRLERLGAVAKSAPTQRARVVIHYAEHEDRRFALRLQSLLAGTPTLQVDDPEYNERMNTLGDVRFAPGDAKLAAEVRSAVESSLAKQGFRLRLELLQVGPKRIANARQGVVEVWLPPLSRASYGPAVRQLAK